MYCSVRGGDRDNYKECVRLGLVKACLQARFKLDPDAKEFEVNAVIVCGAPSEHPNGGTFECGYTGFVEIDLDGSKALKSLYDEQFCGQTASDVRSRAFGRITLLSERLCSSEWIEEYLRLHNPNTAPVGDLAVDR